MPKVLRVIDQARREGEVDDTVVGPGGRYVRYRGSEVGTRDGVGLYSDVADAIAADRARLLLGWRCADTYQTSRGSSNGTWTRPDLVVAAHPLRRRTRDARKRLHALEVETRAGFDVRSIYQAYEQARGADFAWVFTYASALVGADDKRRCREAAVAAELGVGLVGFGRPTNRSTYRLVLAARDLRPSTTDHTAFVDRALDNSQRTLCALATTSTTPTS